MKKNTVIVIAGPTASGKSQLAIDVALGVNGVILNADSMQIYQGIPILSAAPNNNDKQLVEHRLYELFPNNFRSSVIDWLDKIVPEIYKLWAEDKIPVVVGGTGLYIDNLVNGTTPIPETSQAAHEQTMSLLAKIGVQKLHKKLSEIDKVTASKLSENDTTRVRRAYEVWLDTQVPLSEWYKKEMIKKLPEANFYVIKIMPEQKELDERCYVRFDRMIKEGALKEVEKIYKANLDRTLPVMKALGLPELLDFFEQKTSLQEAVNLAKLHTRQYAKRQLTWFKKQLKADFEIDHCYCSDKEILKNIIFDVKNRC